MDSRIEIRPGRFINIRLYQHPSSAATIFLIHGLGARGDQWREQIEALKNKYTLIIPDLYGHGNSDKPKPNTTNPYSFTELEQDLQALFLKYSTEHNIIFGHSYGGALAVALTLEHQDNVEKLILIAPTPCAPNLVVPIVFRIPEMLMELFRGILEKRFVRLAFDATSDQKLIDIEVQASHQNPMYMIKGMLEGMAHMPQIDVTMLTVPTLMILGEHDKLILPAISTAFYQALPHLQTITIKDAAHMLQLERPQAVDAEITRFLDSRMD